jgi:predicted RNase H-like HicB family nuclease
MATKFTLEYWKDDDWYVGRLREVPGVFSQGETIRELETNIRDAYRLILKERPTVRRKAHHKQIAIPA